MNLRQMAVTKAGKKVILVREETNPEDVDGMRASQAILTARGGMTSHAAVVARGMGRACVAGAGGLPLADVIVFENGHFTLDQVVIRHMVDAAPTADPRHTPSTVKREARKMDTRAMYATWQKAFQTLRKKHPGRSDVWYSQQIAKSGLAQGRNASTIKKHMRA